MIICTVIIWNKHIIQRHAFSVGLIIYSKRHLTNFYIIWNTDSAAQHQMRWSIHEWWIDNNIWKEPVMTYLKVLSWWSPGETEKNHEKPHYSYPETQLRYKSGSSMCASYNCTDLLSMRNLITSVITQLPCYWWQRQGVGYLFFM